MEPAEKPIQRILGKRNLSLIKQYKPKEIKNKQVKQQIPKIISEERYKFYLGFGNNSDLVRKIMSHRNNWVQHTDPKYMFINFRWQQTNKGYRYESCIQNKVFRQILNHFEFHQELSNKEYLLKNLTQYCQHMKRNVFDIVPITFVLNLNQNSFDNNLNIFLKFFQHNIPANLKTDNRKFWLSLKRKITNHYPAQKKNIYFYCKPQISDVFLSTNSSYVWILKPTFLNRGRGIHVFNDLNTLETLINNYILGRQQTALIDKHQLSDPESQNKIQINKKLNSSINLDSQANRPNSVIKTNSFVVQKYIEKPLLISNRKFDIRVWVLWSHESKVYFFKQGYLRTSSQNYRTDSNSLNNQFIHLTNNAVQKYNKSYSKHEVGNQLSFRHLEDLFIKYGFNFEDMLKKMKQIILFSALSVKKKINRLDRSYCFQIFGYDFMIDQTSKLWLIEVNTNPCIEESSPILEVLLPRMLDDAFKLTIDKIFGRQQNKQSQQSRYVISHYQNKQNLWEMLVDLKK